MCVEDKYPKSSSDGNWDGIGTRFDGSVDFSRRYFPFLFFPQNTTAVTFIATATLPVTIINSNCRGMGLFSVTTKWTEES